MSLRRCQRLAYFPKPGEMVLFGPDLVALFPIQDQEKQLSATPASNYGFL
jgi:hypothetical protein